MKFTNSLAELGTLSAVGQSNLKLDELIKKNNELKNISSSIGASQNELVKLNKQLVDIQSKILDGQNIQIDLQQKQLLLNEQQLIIQKKQLAEQEIQTNIHKRSELDRLKQQELKKAIYSVNEEVIKISKIENNISRYFEIVLLIKDVTNNNIVPNEFENIADKEYAAKIYNSIEETHKAAYERLNDEEKQDINSIEGLVDNAMKNIKILSNNEHLNLKNEGQKVKEYIDNLESEKERITKYKNNLVRRNNNIWTIIVISVIAFLFILLISGSGNSADIFRTLLPFILIISAIAYFVNKKLNSSTIERNNSKISIIENELSERKEFLRNCDKRVRDLQIAQTQSKRELNTMIEQNKRLIDKYPDVKKRLFAGVETYLN